jgi:hypothetical protein
MKSFSFSTILGLALGILFAGYAVFAFNPPTSGPPGGITDAQIPLNTGPLGQTKQGGLVLNTSGALNGLIVASGNVGIGTASPGTKLDVDGPVRVGRYSTKPTCDANTLGSFVFDTTNNKPYTCVSGGVWKPLDSDFDSDGITDAIDTNDNNANDATAVAGDARSGKTFYAGSAARTGSIANCAADNGGACFIAQATKSALDTDLAAANIKSGVNIFGIAGAFAGSSAIFERWDASFSDPNGNGIPADGLWHDIGAPFTIPANSGGWAGSYFGTYWSCNGCTYLAGLKVACDGADVYSISFRGGIINYHSPLIPGTGSARSCTHRSLAGNKPGWGPSLNVSGIIDSAH